MPAQPILHPSVESLKAFGLGKMDATSAGALIDHLDQCHECSKAVAALSGDDFLARICQAHDQNATPTPIKPLSPILRDPKPVLSAPKNPPSLPDLPPELADHPQYEILRELGRGGMGVVYLAKNKLMDRLEVLKVVNKALLDHPSAVERFLREIRSAAKLSHANVVGAYNALQVGDLLAFAMEYVEGEDLAIVVGKHGPLPITQACYYVQQAALGLQHACEKGMVHRDIKPQNLILARVGKAHVVKVLDFGLAKVVREKAENTGLTGEGKMMGTPDYMAPEQTIDAASADIRADIYSLGCTLYHLLTGAPPFEGRSLYAVLHAHQSVEARSLNLVRPDVPEALAAVVAKMIAKESDKRYQKPIEVVQALAVFVKPDAKKGPPKPPVDRPARGTEVPSGRPIAPPLAEVVRKASVTQAAAAVAWDALTDAPNAPLELRRSQITRKRRSSASRKNWLIGSVVTSGLLLALLGLWAAGVFKVKTKDGTIVLENVPADAEVIVDGETVRLRDSEGKEVTIRVAAGRKHQVQVKREGFKVFGQEVEIDAGGRRAIVVRLQPKLAAKIVPAAGAEGVVPAKPVVVAKDVVPIKPAAGAADDKGFVPLFNGKDLTGWKRKGTNAMKWRVADSLLVGENKSNGYGPSTAGSLITERTDYGNFHLRVETMLSEGISSLIRFRQKSSDLKPGEKIAYWTLLGSVNPGARYQIPGASGTLYVNFRGGPRPRVANAPDLRLKAGEWFRQEIIAEGSRLRVLINGTTVVDYVDAKNPLSRGSICLDCASFCTLRCRKIEIKELPAAKTELPNGGRD